MNDQIKAAIKYCTLPGIVPRARSVFASGFSYTAMLIAYIFNIANLIPDGHPYLDHKNMGRFGVRHVIAQAANNLKFDKKHLDQIFLFSLIMVGLIILIMQFFLLVFVIVIPYANALTISDLQGFFTQPAATPPDRDIALMLLDASLGIPSRTGVGSFFNTCLAYNGAPFCIPYTDAGVLKDAMSHGPIPTDIHRALHALLAYYNTGILCIAFVIFMYYIVAITLETLQSGTPFGQRFNRLWAPIRFIFVLALLIPMSNYNNLSHIQILTAKIAKWGSGFATRSWNNFVDLSFTKDTQTPVGNILLATPNTILGNTKDLLVASPQYPPINRLAEFMLTARTCVKVEQKLHRRGLNPDGTEIPFGTDGHFAVWVIGTEKNVYDAVTSTNTYTPPYVAKMMDITTTAFLLLADDLIVGKATGVFGGFSTLISNVNFQSFTIRIGVKDEVNYANYRGSIRPICGEIYFPLADVSEYSSLFAYFEWYFKIVSLWQYDGFDDAAESYVQRTIPTLYKDPTNKGGLTKSDVEWMHALVGWNEGEIWVVAVLAERSPTWQHNMKEHGWAGAAIWFNKIAQINGGVFDAVYSIPVPALYPEIMEFVSDRKSENDQYVTGTTRFEPHMSDGQMIEFQSDSQLYAALAMYHAQQAFISLDSSNETGNSSQIDSIFAIFGLNGLMNLHSDQNYGTHPLALLIGIGKPLFTTSLWALGGSIISPVVAGMTGNDSLKDGVGYAAEIMSSIAKIGLAIGFILYYVVPFFPFIYMFFAAGGWVKAIFEAMVGTPLFALSHMRIDGNGLPGPVAMNGYFLLFEIFLRPFLIICGFILSIIIFSAQVELLHGLFPLVTSNLSGFDPAATGSPGVGGFDTTDQVGSADYYRDMIDQFFYTIIYVILVYMMAVASFKLIDLVPNYILRWCNAGVSTFSEQDKNPVQAVVHKLYIGINQGVRHGTSSPLFYGLMDRNG